MIWLWHRCVRTNCSFFWISNLAGFKAGKAKMFHGDQFQFWFAAAQMNVQIPLPLLKLNFFSVKVGTGSVRTFKKWRPMQRFTFSHIFHQLLKIFILFPFFFQTQNRKSCVKNAPLVLRLNLSLSCCFLFYFEIFILTVSCVFPAQPEFPLLFIFIFFFLQLASLEASPDAMASSHSSSPVPRPSSGGRDGIFHKEQGSLAPRCRPVRSLPDVCPKEPTGGETQALIVMCQNRVPSLNFNLVCEGNYLLMSSKLLRKFQCDCKISLFLSNKNSHF